MAPRPDSVACPLHQTAQRHPNAVALRDTTGVQSYAELDAVANGMAAQLAWRGVRAGQVVALHASADRAVVALLFGIWRVGAVACPLGSRNPPAVLHAQAQRAGTAQVVSDFPDAWAEAALPVVGLDGLRAAVAAQPALVCERAERPLAAQAPATMLFTSGSTAAPKIAVHSLGNHLANATAANAMHALAPGDAWLLALPLYHVGGLAILFRCFLAGAAVAIPMPQETLAVAGRRLGVTHLSMVPTQLLRALGPGRDQAALPGLKLVLLGGAPAPNALVRDALRFGWPVCKTYGLTELSSQVSTVPPRATPAQQLSGGRLLEGLDLRVATDGELRFRGPALFLGYFENGRCRPAVDADGYFATGDLGSCDRASFLTITGRKDNLFISGGENIQPEEIETALATLPSVSAAVVVPVPDAAYGERPVAFVAWRTGTEANADRLDPARALVPLLARFKVPAAFHALPDEADANAIKIRRQTLKLRALELQQVESARAAPGETRDGQSWQAWSEWKFRCALGRCPALVRAELQAFAHRRFHYYAQRVSDHRGGIAAAGSVADIDPARAWHLFETHLFVRSTRGGKRYKDWLFARLECATDSAPAAVIASGATLIMRDVVREHLRREVSPTGFISLQTPLVAGLTSDLTLETLLPGEGEDPVGEVASREYPALARQLADRVMAELPPRMRVALLAKCLGLNLAHPDVEAAAGARKTALNNDFAEFRRALHVRVAKAFIDEGPGGVADLLRRTTLEIQERIFLWGKAERSCARLFMDIEGGIVADG